MPKFNLLYFKELLDVALVEFFDLYSNDFKKIDGKYVLSSGISKQKLISIFKELIVNELKTHILKFDITCPQYYIIIGACMPKDNILLTCNDTSVFPYKLQKLLQSDYNYKYILKEKDIDIDIIRFNDLCLTIFDEFFARNKVEKYFGKEYKKNVIFITHKNLDCYTMFKVLKSILGKANCLNLRDIIFSNKAYPIVAINDLIDKYSLKHELNKSPTFKNCVLEIQNFLKLRLATV